MAMIKTENKKKAFLETYEKQACNIKRTCKAIKVDRSQFYQWKEKDKAFATAVSDIEEGLLDDCESMLYKQIVQGELTAVIFYLKTKGKKRGYSEKEFEIQAETPNITVIVKDTSKKD